MPGKPIEQESLYSMDKYINDLILLYDSQRLPNKILLSGYKGIGKSILSYHLINYIFSKKEDFPYDKENFKINTSNRSFNLVKRNSHPNFYLVSVDDSKKNIDINQIRNIITFCNKSSFNNSEKIVLIDNVENLNKNSANALLKVIEEPNDKVIFILIKDSGKKLIKTIHSRCINFNINLNHDEKLLILNNILEDNFYNNLNDDFKSYFFSPGDYVNLYHFFSINDLDIEITIEELLNYIIKNNLYKSDIYIKNNLNLFFELYFSKKFFLFKNNISAFNDYKKFTKEVHDIYKYNLDLESIIIQFKKKILYEK